VPIASLADEKPNRRVVVTTLGIGQILSWGSTFYLLAVLAPAIVRDTGWAFDRVISGVSVGLLVAGIVSPPLGRVIGGHGGRSVLALGAGLIAGGLGLLGTVQTFAWYLAAGNGIGSIARRTLPLALFGPARYPVLMGRLGLPIMIAMAASPFAGAVVFQAGGADWTLGMLAALASINVLLVAALWRSSRAARMTA